MLKGYIYLTWKMLLRDKTFTTISLFGISLTLCVLITISTVFDNYLFHDGPEKTNNNFLLVRNVIFEAPEQNFRSGKPGYVFFDQILKKLKVPQLTSAYEGGLKNITFVNNKKYTHSYCYTDANYWKILDFDFLQGRAFSSMEFEQGSKLAVISFSTAIDLFQDEQAIGKTISVHNQQYHVIGVVKDVSSYEPVASYDIWIPYTTYPSVEYQKSFDGNWAALLFHQDKKKLQAMKTEYAPVLKNNFEPIGPWFSAEGIAETKYDRLGLTLYSSQHREADASSFVKYSLFYAFLIMLLPTVNLVNLNISRIMERSTEIGLRKALGASRNQLLLQFIVENIFITLIGCLFGTLLSVLIIDHLTGIGFVRSTPINFNLRCLAYALVWSLLFGFLSAVLPAYRMSRLHPVIALKKEKI